MTANLSLQQNYRNFTNHIIQDPEVGTLSAYQYTIWHKSGATLSDADALSRLPRPTTSSVDCLPGDIHLIDHLSATTVTATHIKEWTSKDPVLSKVRKYVMVGWPDEVGIDLKPHWSRWQELSTLDGCILWRSRVVVPPQGRAPVLGELHETHQAGARWKHSPEAKFGGLRWIKELKTWLNDARRIGPPHCQLLYTHGNGRINGGVDFICRSILGTRF